MRASSFILAFSLPLFAAAPVSAAEAAPPIASAPSESDLEQRALTQKQIEGLVASHEAILAILDKIPDDKRDEPAPEVQAALDKAARSFGFKDYGELDEIAGNVQFLLAGFDKETKTFIGHAAALKQQISAIEQDSTLKPKQKERRIKKLKQSFADIPQVQFPANIPLVTKYYDKLADMFDE